MTDTASIIQFQKKQESKFLCSDCGADRGCDCNAPAVERLAEKLEQARQRQARYEDKKRKQKQQTSDVRKTTDEGETVTVEDELEPDEYRHAFIMRTADAMSFAVYSGKVDDEVIAAAKRVVVKWQDLVQTMEREHEKATS